MSSVVLVGLGPTSYSALESLAGACRVQAVVRDIALETEDPVVQRAHDLGAELVTDVSAASLEALVARLRPDCVVVSSYNRILKPRLLQRCPFVNVHYSPLPHYRGRANVNWALINGESHAAITIHMIVAGLDAGNVLYQQLVPIGPHDTVSELYARLNAIQAAHLGPTVLRLLAGYTGTPQDHAAATYGCTRVPDDGEIDWSQPTAVIDRLIRALTPPFPGAYTFANGRQMTIWQASPVADPPRYAGRVPGRLVARSLRDGTVDVLTGDGILRLQDVQMAGAPRTRAADLLCSTQVSLGLRTIDLLRRIEVLEQQLMANSPTGQQRGVPNA
jgi:methionyl-tRNA formyltransferase